MFLRHNSDKYQALSPAIPFGDSKDGLLTKELVKANLLCAADAKRALAMSAIHDASLPDILIFNGFCAGKDVYKNLAKIWNAPFLEKGQFESDVETLRKIGVEFCLRNKCLPIIDKDGNQFFALSQPDKFDDLVQFTPFKQKTKKMAVVEENEIIDTVLQNQSEDLANLATLSLKASQSCRDFKVYDPTKTASVGIIAVFTAIALAPTLLFTVLFCLASFVLLMNTGFKLWVTAAFMRGRELAKTSTSAIISPPENMRLPTVSILIPLFHETDIAERLVIRMAKIRYPPALLDIMFLVEEADHATKLALCQAKVPQNMRIITVPDGPIRTKPRAMNYALPLCRGSIIGIYDAEDAPESDQILKIVAKFQTSSPKVACLQARLDFYNTSRNWLARCFTVEYATWFRVILPGLQCLKMPIPLGGTSVFFRRNVLEKVGAWDAHNVTEDADLGMRLARNGFKTELVNSTTYEEANCRPWPWIKQRSRWLKGYGLTYFVMMRKPLQLIRDVGFINFCGVQILFLGTLTGFILAPVLLSFWFLTMGLPHPSAGMLPQWLLWALLFLFIMAEIVTISVGLLSISIRGNAKGLGKWVPTMHFYFPMASIGAFKAIYEIATAPFYWDKTQHGAFHDEVGKN